MAEEPKLIIDTDWKSQAQAEKERLAQKTAPKPATGAPEASQEIRIEDVVNLLATQAMSYLGYYADPQTGQAVVSLEYAKLHIDMLALLEAKTKGNLSEQEEKYLTKAVSQLRMEFVEISKVVAKAVQEGRIKPIPAAGVAPPAGATSPPKPAP